MFTIEECKNIISLSETNVTQSNDGQYPNYEKINFTNWSIKNNDNTKWIFDKLFNYFTLNTNIEFITKPNAFSLMKYSEGDQFERHFDTNNEGRLWNIGTQLNSEYEGGDFILYNPEKTLDKIPGEIYVFKSEREHEVKLITKGVRWSLIMFILSKHINKKVII